MIQIKRVYEPAAPEDGYRVLVDRLWPRGIKKEVLQLDAWAKTAAPSNELRQWYHQHLEQQEEFSRRYRQELNAHPEYWMPLLDQARQGNMTLLYAAKNIEFNHAQVLAEFLEEAQDRMADTSSPVCYANQFKE